MLSECCSSSSPDETSIAVLLKFFSTKIHNEYLLQNPFVAKKKVY